MPIYLSAANFKETKVCTCLAFSMKSNMAAAYVNSFVMRTVGERVIWLSGPNCKKQYSLLYFTHDNKRRKKIERNM
jgi:hypothetical protein